MPNVKPEKSQGRWQLSREKQDPHHPPPAIAVGGPRRMMFRRPAAVGMASASDYYFVRVNGRTVHNDPARGDCYVEGEPPVYPATAYDYAGYCLRYDVVRLGWPGAGDLRRGEDVPNGTPCYGTLSDHVRGHLREFRSIAVGAGVLMPDRQRTGVIYAGDVTLPYSYFFEIPAHPFECAHRVGVRWDLD